MRDTGPGLRPEVRERVFERFYQDERTACTSRKGLGLGLYICKQLVEAQGGSLWVESRLGEGSTFCFTLPVFSLPALLAPVLAPGGRCVGAAGVVCIEAVSAGRFVPKGTLQNGLSACRAYLLEDGAAGAFLLPELGAGPPSRILLVVPDGAAASATLAARLQQALQAVLQPVHSQLEPRVAWRMLDLLRGLDAAATLAEVASFLERIAKRSGPEPGCTWKEGRSQ
jgi:hypothetical protein